MGTIYQSECSHCGAIARFAAGYLAVQLDTAPSDRTTHSLDNRIVPLGHPGEGSALESLGYSFGQAAKEARLSRFYAVLCADCGTRFEQRSFLPPTGCLHGCTTSLVIATAVAYFADQSWSHLFGTFLAFIIAASVALFLWGVGANKLNRIRYAAQIAEIERLLKCPRCGSVDFQIVNSKIHNHTCPDCNQQTLSVEAVGKS